MAEATLTEADIERGDYYLPSADMVEEAAFLVSRGVRHLALVGHCPADPVVMLRVRSRLAIAAIPFDTIPFVLTEPDNPESAAFGYAAHRWVVTFLEFLLSPGVAPARKHEGLGLLLGYSASAIARHQELGS